MRVQTKLLLGFAWVLAAAFPAAVSAQTFTPIAGGFDCARFPDGHQEITRATATGFEVLKPGKVRNLYAHESKTIRRRLKGLDKTLKAFEDDRVAKSKLLKVTNKIVTKIFGDPPIPDTIPEGALELKFLGLRARLEERLALNATILSLIDDCLAGKTPGGGDGTVVSPTVTAVSIKGIGSVIYGGWVASTAPLLVQFATEPGGFNACVKYTYPDEDGYVHREYSGLTDEGLCGIGTFVFDTAHPVECDALLPAGKVGIVKQSYSIVDITGTRTLEELFEDARLEAQARLPTVNVLAFLTQGLTRDERIALCETF